jgi:mono/diheme cytochrome c family protein
MHRINARALLIIVPGFLNLACANSGSEPTETPHVSGAKSPVEAGRYLTTVAGCHDCHTPGFMQNGWAVPESDWFTGVPLGWRGPWGTTYGRNLRLTVQSMTEDQWVEMLKSRTAMPPMPWAAVNRMSEPDMRAIYQYLKSLGPAGEQPPAPVSPDQEPVTPYIVLAPPTFPN